MSLPLWAVGIKSKLYKDFARTMDELQDYVLEKINEAYAEGDDRPLTHLHIYTIAHLHTMNELFNCSRPMMLILKVIIDHIYTL